MDKKAIQEGYAMVEAARGRVTEASGMRRNSTAISASLEQTRQAIDDARNIINYRIHGEGSRDTLDGTPFLDDKQKREAQQVERKLQDMRNNLDKVAADYKRMRRDLEGLDDFMQMN